MGIEFKMVYIYIYIYIYGLEVDIEFEMGYLDPDLFWTQAHRHPGLGQTRGPGHGDRAQGPRTQVPGPGPRDPDRGPGPGNPGPGPETLVLAPSKF